MFDRRRRLARSTTTLAARETRPNKTPMTATTIFVLFFPEALTALGVGDGDWVALPVCEEDDPDGSVDEAAEPSCGWEVLTS
jgi:hypothetical protein